MSFNNFFTSFLQMMIDFVNGIFGLLGVLMQNFDGSGLGINYMDYVNEYRYIFVVLAYSFLTLFLGINIITNTISADLFTLRGGGKVLGQLLIGKIMIDLSGLICTEILEISTYITSLILDKALTISVGGASEYTQPFPDSGVPIVGGIVNLILAIINLIPTLLMLLAVGISAVFIYVKLIMRTFQIAILMTISPPFFACLAADTTREYFKRWLNAFLSTAVEIIFMAMIFSMGVAYLNDNSFFTDTSWSLVAISMCIMMANPPRFLKNLVS